ncbi:MAG: hypothetical protein GX850_04425 [Clostridiaceae bacterium]|jgi:host factor-I protein|nr:hypothetical protein [Clostridiaceae bacterium]
MEHYRQKDTSNVKKLPVSQTIRIQETFLNHCRREKIDVIIQLFDQSIVEGLIVGFDQESIVVASRGTQQLIYKTSVVCIKPFEELHLIFNENWRASKTGITYPRVTTHASGRQH